MQVITFKFYLNGHAGRIGKTFFYHQDMAEPIMVLAQSEFARDIHTNAYSALYRGKEIHVHANTEATAREIAVKGFASTMGSNTCLPEDVWLSFIEEDTHMLAEEVGGFGPLSDKYRLARRGVPYQFALDR